MIRFLLLFILFASSLLDCQETKSVLEEKKQQIEPLILELKSWPLVNAKKAAEILIQQKAQSKPFLMMALKNAEPSIREACAYCLGEMKAQEAFPLLLEMALSREMYQKMNTIFVAMMKIDRESAYKKILNLFKASSYDRHSAAYQSLCSFTNKEHLPLLEELFQEKSYKTRKLAIQLAFHTKTSSAFPLFIRGLADDSPYVAFESMNILSKIPSEALQKKLKEQVAHTDRRFLSYVILTLISQEDNFEKKILDDSFLPFLLKSVRNNADLFSQGTSACALVNMGFSMENTEITEIMDKLLPPVLMECLSGKVYFRDYLSLRETAYKKLKQVTGKDLGYQMNKWWAWWHTESHRFRAIRLLKGISQEEIKTMTLEYQQQGSIENQKILFFASPPKIRPSEENEWVIMNYQQTGDLSELLRKIKFFQLQGEYGSKQPLAWNSIEIKLQNLQKRVVVYGKESGPLEPVIDFLLEIARKNSWQIYWDSSKEPDWQKWYERENEWFSEVKEDSLRYQRMKKIILDSYGWLNPKLRERAAEEFLDWMNKNNELSASHIQWILFHIRSEMELNRSNELLIQAVALTKNLDVIVPLCEFLVLHYSGKARLLLMNLMEQIDSKMLLQYLHHPSPHLRSMACEILGKTEAKEITILYLINLLKDENLQVRQSAISALGNLKAKIAWEPVLNIAQNLQYKISLRQSAITALAQISPQQASSILLTFLSNEEPLLRQAALQGLSKMGGTNAIQSLLAILNSDRSPMVREIAAQCLIETKPQNEAIEELLNFFSKTEDASLKLLLLQKLKGVSSPSVTKVFLQCLKNPNPALRMEAAFSLSDRYDTRAVPVLIELLDPSKENPEIRKNLEKITLIVFPQEEIRSLKSRYQEWWNLHKNLSWEQWFFEALRNNTYEASSMLDYFLGEKYTPAMLRLLIRVLQDKDRYLRAAACYMLEKVTEKNFGRIAPHTAQKDCIEIAKAWQKWAVGK